MLYEDIIILVHLRYLNLSLLRPSNDYIISIHTENQYISDFKIVIGRYLTVLHVP